MITMRTMDCGKELERILLVPDTHVPFHDKRAWDLMLKAAKKFNPHTIVHLGDLADFYTISDHERDPRRKHQLDDEVREVNDALNELDDLKPERKVYISGNHEDRLERHLLKNSPALLNSISVPALFDLKRRGWLWVPYRSHARIGKLYVTHDVGYSGVNAIRATGERMGHCVAFGHTHRLGTFYWGSAAGDRYVSASLGWLGDDKEARYVHASTKSAWSLGFGVARLEKNGNVHLQAVPIVGGRCVLDGDILRG